MNKEKKILQWNSWILMGFILHFIIGCESTTNYITLEKQRLFPFYPWDNVWKECQKQDEIFRDPLQSQRMIDFYQTKILESPENADWYFLYGRFLGLIQDADSSLPFFQKALQKDPEGIWGYYGLGMYYLQKKDFFQAKIHFSECLFYQKNFAPALLGMAKIALEQSPLLAISYLEQCIALLPQDASLHHHLGNLYFFHTKEKHKAEAHFLKAVHLSPHNPVFLKDLALYYFDAKEVSKSIEILKQILDIIPNPKQKRQILLLIQRMQSFSVSKSKG
ncbi:MAG: hypothetical protein HUU50_23165 [Candidatus Brocadiae bacterium]|nr:hypothetical protein [Candidatus Brocadiia bacterium]